MEEFYQWLQICHFKKYSIKCEKDLDCELFYSELKRLACIIFTI